jgi:hypothetical protein
MESPIYQNVISMLSSSITTTNTDDIIINYIMKYLNPDIYNSNIWLTPQNICNITKKALWTKREFICIKLIKMYQNYIPVAEFNKLLYTDLIDICITTKNKDMLIWLKNLTSNQDTFVLIDNILENMN